MKPPKTIIPPMAPLYDFNEGVVRIPIDTDLWKQCRTVLAVHEKEFGAMPTPEELETARTDIAAWHRTGDWLINFKREHGMLLDRFIEELLTAAAKENHDGK